ncbi:MAG TPA: hypothetical protein VGS12_16405 [Caulobacteraceae bacterium]|nr:hypothetical protein [Caulobacteraceae bacterium]
MPSEQQAASAIVELVPYDRAWPAQRSWPRVQDYADAKTDVVAQIVGRAEAWRREVVD